MKPWRHAERSQFLTDHSYGTHLAYHMILDCTKDAYSAIPHRYMLHNLKIGSLVLRAAFPAVQQNDLILENYLLTISLP